MKRTIITSIAVLGAWCALGVNFASAQFGNLGQPNRRPAVSPYINLGINGTRGAGTSYYGLIRPQIDANRSITDLQNAMGRMNPDGSLVGQLDQQNPAGAGLGGLQTGHTSSYFNYGHYYPLVGPGGAGAGVGNTGGFGQGLGMGGFNSPFGSNVGGASNAPRTIIGSGGGVGIILR